MCQAMDVGGFEFIGASLLGKEYSTDTINEFYKDVAVYSACYNLSHSKTGKDAMECADYYRDKIKLDENVLYGDFAALDNGDKTEVFSLFNGKKINNPTELNGVFEECVILTKINGAESYGMLNNYLIKYETYLPFSLNDYKASDTTAASRYLFKTNTGFKTMEELKGGVAKAVYESAKAAVRVRVQARVLGSGSSPIKKIEVDKTGNIESRKSRFDVR